MATDKEVNARLIRVYNITLAEYEAMLEQQGFGCAICNRPPGATRLHVDHDHKLKYLSVNSSKLCPGTWLASHGTFKWIGKTKSEAIRGVRTLLKKASVRGILCWTCNAALRSWNDNVQNLAAASEYLKRYELTKRLNNITTKKQGDSNGE
jgi:sulfur relay (sulfurtransferase) DsrF/TusC family protein